MESRAKLLGHPIHQMLIVFPLGLLATAAIFDVVHWITDGPTWALVSFYMIAAGICGGLLAAVFGFIDFLAIPKHTRARRIGAVHGIGNVVVIGTFCMSLVLRLGHASDPPFLATVLAVGATLGALVTGWLGGELVNRLSVGVDDGANVDAPSSLSERSARRSPPPDRMAAD